MRTGFVVRVARALTGRENGPTGGYLYRAGEKADVLAPQKRWCPCCWADDALKHGLYEHKLWSLSVVDACPIHSTILMARYYTCCRQQPPISSDLGLGICSRCGWSLASPPVRIDGTDGSDGSRRLWSARQAADMIHAVDVARVLRTRSGHASQGSGGTRLQRLCAHVVCPGDRRRPLAGSGNGDGIGIGRGSRRSSARCGARVGQLSTCSRPKCALSWSPVPARGAA